VRYEDPGSFVWADTSGLEFISERAREFAIRAAGGMRVQSQRGIALDSGNSPIVTRAYDVFDASASINKQGLGRWGLFMEPYQLTVGMPDVASRRIAFAKYAVDGTYTTLMSVDQAGNLYTLGLVNPPSDVNLKTAFAEVSAREVLRKVAALPIRSWAYKTAPEVRHLGPTAQDFQAAFGVGTDDRHIATVDADGVALAAIQGLHQVVQEKDREIRSLKWKAAKVDALERDVAQLKSLVKALAGKSR
jgi:hypothetical protein